MPDPTPGPDLQAAVEHLRRYDGQYSVEALTEQLRQQGIDEQVLAQAVFTYNQEREARVRSSKRIWGPVGAWTCGILVAIAVIGLLVVGLCIAELSKGPH